MPCASRASRPARRLARGAHADRGRRSPAGRQALSGVRVPIRLRQNQSRHADSAREPKGWKVWTLGDDIAWMHLDADGQLRAINPEAGYFGVVPGTNPQTNRNAYDMISTTRSSRTSRVTAENDPWWEDKGSGKPASTGMGAPTTEERPRRASELALYRRRTTEPELLEARRRARRRTDLRLIFGGRRRELAPLVYQAKDWAHGVLVGAGVASRPRPPPRARWASCAVTRWP